jgi:hypothetical protein
MSGNALLLLLAAAFGAWALVEAVWYATGFTSDPVARSVGSRIVRVDVPPPGPPAGSPADTFAEIAPLRLMAVCGRPDRGGPGPWSGAFGSAGVRGRPH